MHYDKYSILQRIVADRLNESLEQIKINPMTILDLGSGTGYGSKILHKKFTNAHIYQIDFSENMLKVSRKKSPVLFSRDPFICADINKLPFKLLRINNRPNLFPDTIKHKIKYIN